MRKSTNRLLQGLLMACLIGGLIGCDKSDTESSLPDTDKSTSDQEFSTGGGIAAAIRDQADVSNLFDEDDPLPEDVPDLMSYLARKQIEQLKTQDKNDGFRIQKQRAIASAELLSKEITPDQRSEFVNIRLDSLLKLIAAGDPQAKLDFQATLGKYETHKQERIRQAVSVAGLIHDFRQVAGQPTPDFDPVLAATEKTISEHPSSFDVCKEVGNIGEQLLAQGQRKTWQQVADKLIAGYQESENAACRNYVTRLAGRVQVASANLDLIVDEIRQQTPGAFDKYRKAVQFLFSSKNVSVASIEPVVGSLRWLEQTGMMEEAGEANRIVKTASLDLANAAVRSQLRENCSRRDTRIGWIGRPFAINAVNTQGETFQWDTFQKQRPSLVVFWSAAEPASVAFVQKLAETRARHGLDKLNLLSVCLSGNPDIKTLFGAEQLTWTTVQSARSATATDPAKSPFIATFGMERVPQLFLVDKAGNVARINPPVQELDRFIEALK